MPKSFVFRANCFVYIGYHIKGCLSETPFSTLLGWNGFIWWNTEIIGNQRWQTNLWTILLIKIEISKWFRYERPAIQVCWVRYFTNVFCFRRKWNECGVCSKDIWKTNNSVWDRILIPVCGWGGRGGTGVTVIDCLFSCMMYQISEAPPSRPPPGKSSALAARAEETRQTNIQVHNKKSLVFKKL